MNDGWSDDGGGVRGRVEVGGGWYCGCKGLEFCWLRKDGYWLEIVGNDVGGDGGFDGVGAEGGTSWVGLHLHICTSPTARMGEMA